LSDTVEPTTEAAPSTDIRAQLGKQLESKFTPEQLNLLINEVLAIKKSVQVEVRCKHCNRAQKVLGEMPDARSVTTALKDLLNQAWGAPVEQRAETEFKLVRHVFLISESETGEQASEEVQG
jgi:hypothetical protein